MTLWSWRENSLKDKVNIKIFDVITLTNNYNTHIVQYAHRIQVPLWSCSWITSLSQYILPCQLVWVFNLSESFMGTDEDPCQNSLHWSTWTERPTAFRLTRVLALSFLPDLGVSSFLLSLFTDPVAQNMCPYLCQFGFSRDGCWSWTYGEILLVLCFKWFRPKITIIFSIIYYNFIFSFFSQGIWLIICSCYGRNK